VESRHRRIVQDFVFDLREAYLALKVAGNKNAEEMSMADVSKLVGKLMTTYGV